MMYGGVEIGKPLRAGAHLQVIRFWRHPQKGLMAVMQNGFTLSRVEFYKTGEAWLSTSLLFLVLRCDFFLTRSHHYDNIHHEALTRAQKMPVSSCSVCEAAELSKEAFPPSLFPFSFMSLSEGFLSNL